MENKNTSLFKWLQKISGGTCITSAEYIEIKKVINL